jgi:Protein of unknown function (DUF2971)
MADEAALRIKLQLLFNDLLSREQAESHRYPEQLYHYTDVEGLKGILDSGKIWATQTKYLNDSQEVSYGRQLALDVCREITHQGAVQIIWLDRVSQAISAGIPGGEPYVACFCEHGDLLSQWRGYGRGYGYSVGLRPRGKVYSRLPSKLCSLVQVVYDPETQRRIIRELVDRYLDSLSRFVAQFTNRAIASHCNSILQISLDDEHDVSKLSSAEFLKEIVHVHLSQLSLELDSMFSRFKHVGFEEEKEWRLIHYNSAVRGSQQVEYRPSNGVLVPYVELPLFWDEEGEPGMFQITQITCGPNSQPEAARASVEYYVTKLRAASNRQAVFDKVGVTNSKTPLKTW